MLLKVLGMSPLNLEIMRMQWSNRTMPLSCISEVILYNGLSFNSLLVFTGLENSLCIRCQMLSFPGSFKEHTKFVFCGFQLTQLSSSSNYVRVFRSGFTWERLIQNKIDYFEDNCSSMQGINYSLVAMPANLLL